MSILTKEKQIELLQSLDWNLLCRAPGFESRGLCYLLKSKLRELYPKHECTILRLPLFFPLFIRTNAVKHCGAIDGSNPDDHWWALNASGDQQRMKFIDWIINTLKQSE